VTEFTEIPERGHALTIDNGWAQVAQTALAFIRRFTEQPRDARSADPHRKPNPGRAGVRPGQKLSAHKAPRGGIANRG